ncbi:hypothetical protein DFJ73DRAFT_857585 [Zopfochytrium polystomum]|nr:hypothetical protein DFJ73DRAFT_857585 [Zopfochytrium polystomum]
MASSSYLDVYTINGKPLRDRMFNWRINDLACSPDGSMIVAADNKGGMVLLVSHTLQISHRFDVSIPVLSVALSDSLMFMGRSDGKLLVIAHDPKSSTNNGNGGDSNSSNSSNEGNNNGVDGGGEGGGGGGNNSKNGSN